MQRFAQLFQILDEQRGTNAKVIAMAEYFQSIQPKDGAWAVYFLSGRRLKRLIGPVQLRQWLADISDLPIWLIEESHEHVGDLAETIALVLDRKGGQATIDQRGLATWVEEDILTLREMDEEQRRERVVSAWQRLDAPSRFLYTKLLTGALRVGVSQTLVERALARASGQPQAVIAHRLMGQWQADTAFYQGLFDERSGQEDASRPYPFFLANPLENPPEQTLGAIDDWQLEWKWDGIRAQVVRRERAVYLWSRGEALIGEQFPDILAAAQSLPVDTVLDGEILAWSDQVMPFSALQRRLGRKRVSQKLMDEVPARLMVYDVLERNGQDVREQPMSTRRRYLEACLVNADPRLMPSALIAAPTWQALSEWREQSRERGVEGIMLKANRSTYATGRPRGAWWKWKIDPLTLDVVLLYAQPGHGRRANLYTDYSFAVRDGDNLVPIAKAYSGLTDVEIRKLDHWIRRHTRERFGPVRSVEPEQIFELAFEGITSSPRHKSGLALRFPRIARWRKDLGSNDVDTLEQAKALLS
ncbi:MAG: ATP-dependent DNA ligase [Spiribacter sp.]|jgi:DNA ligase-1|nr:ATP-dependent DNA ligase [Spiribacter sp.]MDR9488940.1 ATP-dependent DNA ligase [Spiribacter sp.]